MMRPAPETSTRPQLRRRRRPRPVPLVTVVVSVALVSLLCLPVAADASRALHHNNREQHRGHQNHRTTENKKNSHVSLPPDADGGDSPPEPPEADGGAPPPPLPPPPPEGDDDCGDVFDVRAFGASGGDGGSCGDDDTPAFRAAWKAACSSDSATATLLVPSDGVFTITSTIFSGPCKPDLTFQVSKLSSCIALPPRKINH